MFADGDDDRARVAQTAEDAGVAGGEDLALGAVARGAPGQAELVLDGDRHAVQRPLRRLGQHPLGLLGERRDDRVQRRVALLDPLQRRAQQLGGVEVAGGDAGRLVAQRQVLCVAHEVGARLGSRSASGHIPFMSCCHQRAQLGAEDLRRCSA